MIIGLLGQAGVGKDTVADHLVARHGFVKIGLADPMKRICKEVYNFTDEQLWGPSESRNAPDLRYPNGNGHLSPRVALQTLGTEWARKIYEDTWVNYTLRVANKILSGGYYYSQYKGLKKKDWRIFKRAPKGVVISDMRFINELKSVRAVSNGYVLRVKRPGIKGHLIGVPNHLSEIEQNKIQDSEFDGVIDNTGVITYLHYTVDTTLKRLQSHKKLKVIIGGG